MRNPCKHVRIHGCEEKANCEFEQGTVWALVRRIFRPGRPESHARCPRETRFRHLTISQHKLQSKADGGVNAKRTTRKASRSPPPVTVKKEDRAARGVEANEREAAPTGPPVRDEEQEVRQDMTNLHVNEDSGGSGRGSRPGGGGWPFPVMYGGPVPRSIQDVDRPERLQERRYCGRLFDGTVEYGVDRDGLRECLLIEFPDLLPLDRDRLRKWKAANKNAIERGDEPLLLDDFDFDDDMTDEERTRVVECCTPADLEGLQAGEIIGAWQFSVLI